ncbi:hypothetical protein FXW78_01975 [Rhodococcus opacus]|nr:hypothetical protein [Rhodococcus opacus]RZL75465.1 MAG: hypothetical protein EOP32_31405 [Rhodococcus sp. (in: high G+C Gram-positive bacteria)]
MAILFPNAVRMARYFHCPLLRTTFAAQFEAHFLVNERIRADTTLGTITDHGTKRGDFESISSPDRNNDIELEASGAPFQALRHMALLGPGGRSHRNPGQVLVADRFLRLCERPGRRLLRKFAQVGASYPGCGAH